MSLDTPQVGQSAQVATLAATYLDFDGTLAATNLVHVYAYYARHAGNRVDVATRLAKLAAWSPAFLALDKVSRLAFATQLYALYAGLVFIVSAALILTPMVHRLLHRFHWNEKV